MFKPRNDLEKQLLAAHQGELEVETLMNALLIRLAQAMPSQLIRIMKLALTWMQQWSNNYMFLMIQLKQASALTNQIST